MLQREVKIVLLETNHPLAEALISKLLFLVIVKKKKYSHLSFTYFISIYVISVYFNELFEGMGRRASPETGIWVTAKTV